MSATVERARQRRDFEVREKQGAVRFMWENAFGMGWGNTEGEPLVI
jgi:hypothetical protein